MKRDRQATEAANFIDPRSYVGPDGREVLYREDWDIRKAELWQRAGARCEQILEDGTRCRRMGRDPDHKIKRRTKGSNTRDDRLSNLQLLCGRCHELKHPEKYPRWTKREKPNGPEGISS